ncbi:MAG: hypothetical protein PVH00_11150 [Gemmatimonadota bacterium]|jgi:hypothetical protein
MPIPFGDVRALFPGADARVYLDVAVTGLLPRAARDSIEQYLGRVRTSSPSVTAAVTTTRKIPP